MSAVADLLEALDAAEAALEKIEAAGQAMMPLDESLVVARLFALQNDTAAGRAVRSVLAHIGVPNSAAITGSAGSVHPPCECNGRPRIMGEHAAECPARFTYAQAVESASFEWRRRFELNKLATTVVNEASMSSFSALASCGGGFHTALSNLKRHVEAQHVGAFPGDDGLPF